MRVEDRVNKRDRRNTRLNIRLNIRYKAFNIVHDRKTKKDDHWLNWFKSQGQISDSSC